MMLTDSLKKTFIFEFPPESFTPRAEKHFSSVINHPDFFTRDADLIYQALSDQLETVIFGDYLKRYVYRGSRDKAALRPGAG